MIAPDILKKLIDYDPVTGKMFWLPRGPEWFEGKNPLHRANNWNARLAGKPALASVTDGYLTGGLLGRPVKAHRVAFAIANGRWPVGDIDHINGDRFDNRAANLRECSRAENALNCRAKAGGSGLKGVRATKNGKRWTASIRYQGQIYDLGYFDTANDAARAYDEKARSLHGRFACLNFPALGRSAASSGAAS